MQHDANTGRRPTVLLVIALLTIILTDFNASISSTFKQLLSQQLAIDSVGECHASGCVRNRSVLSSGSPGVGSEQTSLRGQISRTNSTEHNKTQSENGAFMDKQGGNSDSFNISIVVQLSGEMGNHLSKLAFGVALQERLKAHGLHSHLVLQHQERTGKWLTARNDIQNCFPRFRNYDFSLGNTDEFAKVQHRQTEAFGSSAAEQFVFPNMISVPAMDEQLKWIANFIHRNTTKVDLTPTTGQANISIPFIHAQAFAPFELIDDYYERLSTWFEFDKDACCREVPGADEHVFHFRNYLHELPRKGRQKGFEELPPFETANGLFGHLGPGEKVAIITRVDNEAAQAYQSAFEDVGVKARIVENQTGTQDFCFLTQGMREVAGIARSTFFVWGSLLGMSSKAWLYSINSTDTRRALGNDAILSYEWKRETEQQRFKFVAFTLNGTYGKPTSNPS